MGAHRRNGGESGVVNGDFDAERRVGESGEDAVVVIEHFRGGRAQDLHEQKRRAGGEDGGELRLARIALFFQQGRVGGDAFEDAKRQVTGDGGGVGAVEVHGDAPVAGSGGIIQSRVLQKVANVWRHRRIFLSLKDKARNGLEYIRQQQAKHPQI